MTDFAHEQRIDTFPFLEFVDKVKASKLVRKTKKYDEVMLPIRHIVSAQELKRLFYSTLDCFPIPLICVVPLPPWLCNLFALQ